VGERLALQALQFVYEKVTAAEANGPMLKYTLPIENGIELYFANADDGFEIHGETGTHSFDIADADGVFKIPHEVVFSDGKITLKSAEVKYGLYAKYCWINYGEVKIFGRNGLPLAPFNTAYRL
jgi:sialate O-acetylesterase